MRNLSSWITLLVCVHNETLNQELRSSSSVYLDKYEIIMEVLQYTKAYVFRHTQCTGHTHHTYIELLELHWRGNKIMIWNEYIDPHNYETLYSFLAYTTGISAWLTGSGKCQLIWGIRWLSCMMSGCLIDILTSVTVFSSPEPKAHKVSL